MVTKQGTHELVHGLAEAPSLKSRYVTRFLPLLSFRGRGGVILSYFKSAFSFSFNINDQTINQIFKLFYKK